MKDKDLLGGLGGVNRINSGVTSIKYHLTQQKREGTLSVFPFRGKILERKPQLLDWGAERRRKLCG